MLPQIWRLQVERKVPSIKLGYCNKYPYPFNPPPPNPLVEDLPFLLAPEDLKKNSFTPEDIHQIIMGLPLNSMGLATPEEYWSTQGCH